MSQLPCNLKSLHFSIAWKLWSWARTQFEAWTCATFILYDVLYWWRPSDDWLMLQPSCCEVSVSTQQLILHCKRTQGLILRCGRRRRLHDELLNLMEPRLRGKVIIGNLSRNCLSYKEPVVSVLRSLKPDTGSQHEIVQCSLHPHTSLLIGTNLKSEISNISPVKEKRFSQLWLWRGLSSGMYDTSGPFATFWTLGGRDCWRDQIQEDKYII